MSANGAVTELLVVPLLSSECSDRWSETLPPSSCVSSIIVSTAGDVHAKVGDDVGSSTAVTMGAVVVVLGGNSGGAGRTSSEAVIMALAVELLRVTTVE